jgi:hypothetical protein
MFVHDFHFHLGKEMGSTITIELKWEEDHVKGSWFHNKQLIAIIRKRGGINKTIKNNLHRDFLPLSMLGCPVCYNCWPDCSITT